MRCACKDGSTADAVITVEPLNALAFGGPSGSGQGMGLAIDTPDTDTLTHSLHKS
ncbi:uncharacterized protein FOMMEDRAFT_154660 [Fomitiporia mediterranea MF3/22]|uniref:uncharacterized protein n=1 Tax=Fomitiporia mediterranea (strain MF3/22) TaxID=694068 RepID=UPI0004408CB6|nr:uncharacterized protein FOMMEDRAFT_154660 [Fomitiporia mediterranea MF3/22]EJD03579.1 hypothetical protein FOMMEDRAFT_154660 [Fomitiporia mediterranea MF3/22]